MQTPILPGFPQYWSNGAMTPINPPTPIIPQRVANMFFIHFFPFFYFIFNKGIFDIFYISISQIDIFYIKIEIDRLFEFICLLTAIFSVKKEGGRFLVLGIEQDGIYSRW